MIYKSINQLGPQKPHFSNYSSFNAGLGAAWPTISTFALLLIEIPRPFFFLPAYWDYLWGKYLQTDYGLPGGCQQ